MADEECDRSSSPLDETSQNSDIQYVGSGSGERTRIVISKDPSDKEDDNKDDESDSRGMYTANRGFPPSRFAPRSSSFSSPQSFSSNPFAARPVLGRPSMDEGSSSWQGLTPSKLGAFGSSPLSTPKVVLKPAAFCSTNAGNSPAAAAPKSSFPLNPSRLGNPFSSKAAAAAAAVLETKEDEKKDDTTEAAEKAKTPSVKFVPLGTPNSNATSGSNDGSANVLSTPSSFVFGQNLHERVIDGNTPTNLFASTHENGSKEEEEKPAPPTTNGTTTTEMLFSAVVKKDNGESSSAQQEAEGAPAKSLSEAAREYEESRAVKRKFEEVEVKTGEEEETNVLQISCKLYTFDKAKGSWAERGRGQLRLNDKVENHQLQSRVIMRTHGSLRVVLNTKVWPEMVVDRANVKSVRFTAMDDDQIKVFLASATAKEAENLYTALERRVASQRFRASTTPQLDADIPSPDTANSDVEQTRSCIDPSTLPSEPSPKKGKSSLPDEQENTSLNDSDAT